MPHTISPRRIKRLEARRKHGSTKQRLKNDPDYQGRKKGQRKNYVGVRFGDDFRVEVLHPTKGWRNYNIDNPIIGI